MSAGVEDRSTDSGDESTEPSKSSTKGKSARERLGNFWKRLVDFADGYSKVLGAVVVTASVISLTYIAITHFVKNDSSPSGTPSPSAARSSVVGVSASPSDTATPTSTTPNPNPPPRGRPIYQGAVEITKGGVDLDYPPTVGLRGGVVVGEYGTTLNLSGSEVQGVGIAGGYNGPPGPDESACIQALNQSHFTSTSTLADGQYVCLRTTRLNIAVLKIGKIDTKAGTISVIESLYSP